MMRFVQLLVFCHLGYLYGCNYPANRIAIHSFRVYEITNWTMYCEITP